MEELFEDYIDGVFIADEANLIKEIIVFMMELKEDVTIETYIEYIPEFSSSEEDDVEPINLLTFVRNQLQETLDEYGVITADNLYMGRYYKFLKAIDALDDPDFREDVQDSIESDEDPVEQFCGILGAFIGEPPAMFYDEVENVSEELIAHAGRLINIDTPPDIEDLPLLDDMVKLRVKDDQPTVLEAAYRGGLKTGLNINFYTLITTPTPAAVASYIIILTMLAYGKDDLFENVLIHYNQHTTNWKSAVNKKELLDEITSRLDDIGVH